MARSNAPLALSVVSVTVPGDVPATYQKMAQFDDLIITLSHDRTWRALPAALRGVMDPSHVATSFGNAPGRIRDCITALCALGQNRPRETHKFESNPDSGLQPIRRVQWAPDVYVRVKGVCWFVDERGSTIIPILQLRKIALSATQMGLYVRLARQAFCQGDWVSAQTQVIDLSGDSRTVVANVIAEDEISLASDEEVALTISTYNLAKEQVDKRKKEGPTRSVVTPMDEYLFGTK